MFNLNLIRMKAIWNMSACFFFLLLINSVQAQTCNDTTACPYDCCRPDGHAPLGIMTDHVHGKGEWGFSYSYMNMRMKGNQSGTSRLSDQQVLSTYMMAPTQMTMQMHMAMVMYGINNRLSVMGMFSFAQNAMSMHMQAAAMNMPGMVMTGMNTASTMSSQTSGLGDTKIYGLYKLSDWNGQRIIVSLGLNIPTGCTTMNGLTLEGEGQRLAYQMQTGSGTWDILPAIAYTGQLTDMSWGIQTEANLKPGMNMQGYALGNEFKGNAWVSYRFCKWMSSSIRLEEKFMGQMNGYDPAISLLAANDPSANAANYGGLTTSTYFGLNFYKPSMPLRGNRLLLEYGVPLYQNLNGIQMSCNSTLWLGWQYNF
jgi:hypothetical protein